MPDTETETDTNTVTDLRAHHVGITVSDLEESLEFYRDVLELPVLDRFTVSGDAFATGVGVDGATGTFAHLDADGARIELIEYDPDGPSCTADSVNQTGAKHVGFAVADLEEFYDDLPERVETFSEPQTTESGASILFLRDPEGNLIEVIEG